MRNLDNKTNDIYWENLNEVLKLKDLNEELIDANHNLLIRLIQFSKKNNLPIETETQLLVRKIRLLLQKIQKPLSDETLQGHKSNKNDDNFTEPYGLISHLLFSTALRKTDSKKRESSKLFISILLD